MNSFHKHLEDTKGSMHFNESRKDTQLHILVLIFKNISCLMQHTTHHRWKGWIMFKNASFFVGNSSASKGVMGSASDLCGTYKGPLAGGATVITTCDHPRTGR
jgi:hypothetical protein